MYIFYLLFSHVIFLIPYPRLQILENACINVLVLTLFYFIFIEHRKIYRPNEFSPLISRLFFRIFRTTRIDSFPYC